MNWISLSILRRGPLHKLLNLETDHQTGSTSSLRILNWSEIIGRERWNDSKKYSRKCTMIIVHECLSNKNTRNGHMVLADV